MASLHGSWGDIGFGLVGKDLVVVISKPQLSLQQTVQQTESALICSQMLLSIEMQRPNHRTALDPATGLELEIVSHWRGVGVLTNSGVW
jgi:hypothetical protein